MTLKVGSPQFPVEIVTSLAALSTMERVSSTLNSRTKAQWFQAVPAAAAANTVVLSPSDRARRGFEQSWRAHAMNVSGAALSPEFLTVNTFLAKLWSDAQCIGIIEDERALIGEVIEAALWREAVLQTANFTAAEANVIARTMQEAWSIELRYAQGSAPLSLGANAALYAAAKRWITAKLTVRRALTREQLPLVIAQHASRFAALLPKRIVLTPSFAPIPAVETMLDALCAATTCGLTRWQLDASALSTRHNFAHAFDERNAAIEAATRATESAPLVIVVPDLQQTRGAWQRALIAAGVNHNTSLGLKLSDQPYVSSLLRVIEACDAPIDVETLAQALRHPRWARPDAQQRVINARELALLERGQYTANLSAFDVRIDGVESNAQKRSRTQWALTWELIAKSLVSNSPRADSSRFQLEQAYQRASSEWLALDDWLPPLSARAAIVEWTTALAATPFQAEGSDAPVQLLGLLESAGVPFESVWITGMNDEVLPERSRLNPFLLAAWQRSEGIGLGSVDECGHRAARLWQGWAGLSGRVVVSYSHDLAGREMAASPLIKSIGVQSISSSNREVEPVLQLRVDESDVRWAQSRPLSASKLEAQAQCPRRGWAQIRVNARAWPERFDGVPPIVRGKIVHDIAERIGRARMEADTEAFDFEVEYRSLAPWIDAAIGKFSGDASQINASIWAIETVRLHRLFVQFLELESSREQFRVTAVEYDTAFEFDGLQFRLRIDRVESLDDGSLLILDFKTGQVQLKGLKDERLSSPQLPLYAMALRERGLHGVAYAKLADDDVRYLDFASAPITPGKKAPRATPLSFHDALDRWPLQLSTLIEEVKTGNALVAPINGKPTCDFCRLQRLCRIDLRELSAAAEDEASDE
jgi:ATP-dependent helicase/nuclease subunit B